MFLILFLFLIINSFIMSVFFGHDLDKVYTNEPETQRLSISNVPLCFNKDVCVNDKFKVTGTTGDVTTEGNLSIAKNTTLIGDLEVVGTATFKNQIITSGTLSGQKLLQDTSDATPQILLSLIINSSKYFGMIEITYCADIYDDLNQFYTCEFFTAKYIVRKDAEAELLRISDISKSENKDTMYYFDSKKSEIKSTNKDPGKQYASTTDVSYTNPNWSPTSNQVDFYYQPPQETGYKAKNCIVFYNIISGPQNCSEISVT